MTKKFKNILVIRTDRIGDVVLTTPALSALRQSFPDARITLLLSPLTKDLVVTNSSIDEILIDDRKQQGFFSLVKLIKSKKFDCVINYHTKKRTNLLCFLVGIPYRLGYKNNKYGFLLNHQIKDVRHLGAKHEAQYCLDLLKEIGIESSDLNCEVSLTDASQKWLEEFLKNADITFEKKLVAIHPGASDPSKMWPVENFVELINELQKQGNYRFIVVGAAGLKEEAEKIISSAKARVINLVGQSSVSQLASLINRCDIMISNDSGPVHIASAVGTPVISIFTRNQPGINPERWQPLGVNSRYIAVEPDAQKSFKKAQNYDPAEMEPIAVQRVLEEVDALLKLC